VFWLEEERVVSEDWVVRYKNRMLQLERQTQHWAPAKRRVVVRENESGEIAIYYRQQRLPCRKLPWTSKSMSDGRGPFPRASIPEPRCYLPPVNHLATRLAAYGNTAFFMGAVKLQPGDTSIVENAGTFLLWYDMVLF
jgi:hypothetical protein